MNHSLRSWKRRILSRRWATNYAEFYQKWIKYDGKDNSTFPRIGSSTDADLASMLILFLKASNHKMAITLLGSMYNHVIEQNTQSIESFISTVKAVAAYYFLWRSAYSNSGLDSTYREFFKKHKEITAESVKGYFKNVLENHKEISSFDAWKVKAKNYMKYDTTGKDVIRLALLISAHETTTDPTKKGLIVEGREGGQKYLSVEKWISADLKTIEHIAPQTNKNNKWDANLYDAHIEPYQSLGNLTLLPQDLNSSAGNKGWKEKLLYYQCVAEENPEKIKNIENTANKLGVVFNKDTLELLKSSHFNKHLASISMLSVDDIWNKDLVDQRTDAMLDIIWKRISTWIF